MNIHFNISNFPISFSPSSPALDDVSFLLVMVRLSDVFIRILVKKKFQDVANDERALEECEKHCVWRVMAMMFYQISNLQFP